MLTYPAGLEVYSLVLTNLTGYWFFGAFFASKSYSFKNIFDFTTAGDWDCVGAIERLPVLHYSADFIFLSFGILGFILEL